RDWSSDVCSSDLLSMLYHLPCSFTGTLYSPLSPATLLVLTRTLAFVDNFYILNNRVNFFTIIMFVKIFNHHFNISRSNFLILMIEENRWIILCIIEIFISISCGNFVCNIATILHI